MSKCILLYRQLSDGCGSFEESDLRILSSDFLETDMPTIFKSESEAVKTFKALTAVLYNDGDIDGDETLEYGIFELKNLNQLNYKIELNFQTKQLKI